MKKAMERKETYFSNVLLYGFYYLALALFSSLISIYLTGKGLSATQVSLTVSASCITSMIVQPIVGRLQDRGSKKMISVMILVISSALGLLFMAQNTFVCLLSLYSLTVALSGSVGAYIEKIATTSRFSYRSIRIWGTIGYGIGAQMCGVVYEKISPQSVYAAFSFCILLAAFGIVKSIRPEERAESPERKAETVGGRGNILRNGLFWEYLIISALFYATTNLNSTYLPMLYQEAGVSITTTSTILFIGTLMELPVIFFASLYMNRLSNRRLLQVMFVVLLLQFGTYAFIPVLPVKIGATVLLKSSATMAYIMINLKVVSSLVSEEYQLTALSTVASFKNLTTVLMTVIGGRILDAFSIYTLFIILTFSAGLGLLLAFIFRIPTREETAPRF